MAWIIIRNIKRECADMGGTWNLNPGDDDLIATLMFAALKLYVIQFLLDMLIRLHSFSLVHYILFSVKCAYLKRN